MTTRTISMLTLRHLLREMEYVEECSECCNRHGHLPFFSCPISHPTLPIQLKPISSIVQPNVRVISVVPGLLNSHVTVVFNALQMLLM